MNKGFDINALVDDLEPVRPMRQSIPLALSAAITVVVAALVIWLQGMRPDLLAGHPDQMFLIRSGVLLLLGGATAHAVTSMASPSVGRSQNGWQVALAAAVLFPLAAIIIATTGNIGPAMSAMESGMRCMGYSLIGGLATAVPMVFWLRRGAPTSPERAGWL
ncbi:MAG TPA: NrsF family protein, partial [Sphingorhabdus sp.]|nr:NrsF family protein [Sphingorhabdus sp.]